GMAASLRLARVIIWRTSLPWSRNFGGIDAGNSKHGRCAQRIEGGNHWECEALMPSSRARLFPRINRIKFRRVQCVGHVLDNFVDGTQLVRDVVCVPIAIEQGASCL